MNRGERGEEGASEEERGGLWGCGRRGGDEGARGRES